MSDARRAVRGVKPQTAPSRPTCTPSALLAARAELVAAQRRAMIATARAGRYGRDVRRIESLRRPSEARMRYAQFRFDRAVAEAIEARTTAERAAVLLVAFDHEHPELAHRSTQ